MFEDWYDTIHAWGGSSLLSVEPLSWVALFACFLAGGIIGLERQWQGKPIGIRTSVLICLGTYVFTELGLLVSTEATDPSRIIGQVVTGIGFLGAGVMLTRDGMVVGATSAASIWMLAAIGVVIAAGYHLLGVKLAIISVVVLVGINLAEERCAWLQRGMHHRPGKNQDQDPEPQPRDAGRSEGVLGKRE